jgi:hypothetical protein
MKDIISFLLDLFFVLVLVVGIVGIIISLVAVILDKPHKHYPDDPPPR